MVTLVSYLKKLVNYAIGSSEKSKQKWCAIWFTRKNTDLRTIAESRCIGHSDPNAGRGTNYFVDLMTSLWSIHICHMYSFQDFSALGMCVSGQRLSIHPSLQMSRLQKSSSGFIAVYFRPYDWLFLRE